MLKISLIHAWHMVRMCFRYAWNIPELCLRYASYLSEICLKYIPDGPTEKSWESCRFLVFHFSLKGMLINFEFFSGYTLGMHDICLKYVCQRSVRFVWDIHKIFKKYTWYILELFRSRFILISTSVWFCKFVGYLYKEWKIKFIIILFQIFHSHQTNIKYFSSQ